MKSADRRYQTPPSRRFARRLLAAAAIVGLGLAASACSQSLSEFPRAGTLAATDPVALTPGDPQAMGGVAKPAVLVEETTVPAPAASTARTSAPQSAPMAIAPPQAKVAEAEPANGSVEPSALNLNRLPAQPDSKLLTPDEKARVIAELEALAKKQSATLGKTRKSADCAAQNLDPAQRLASATGEEGC